MILLLLFLLSLPSGNALADPDTPGIGLKAVKSTSKRTRGEPTRTLQEWRIQQQAERAEAAEALKNKRNKSAAAPSPQPDAPAPEGPTAAPATKDKKSPQRKASPAAPPPWFKRYLRELYGLLALLCLWLITRIYGQTSTQNDRQPPPRPSPVTEEELGRIIFSIGRSADVDAYRMLFLSGAEAMQVLGPANTDQYLSERSHSSLQVACGALSAQLPSGTSYVKTTIQSTDRCVLHVANPDGSGREISVGTVAKVGAVFRLIEPESHAP